MFSSTFLSPLLSGLIDHSSPSFRSLPPYTPVYRFNYTAKCSLETMMLPAFRTESKLLASDRAYGYPRGGAQSNLQSYPFDMYAQLYLILTIEKTNLHQILCASGILRIEPGYQRIHHHEYQPFFWCCCVGGGNTRAWTDSDGLVSVNRNFQVTPHSALQLHNDTGKTEWISVILKIERSQATKTFVILVATTNCKLKITPACPTRQYSTSYH